MHGLSSLYRLFYNLIIMDEHSVILYNVFITSWDEEEL